MVAHDRTGARTDELAHEVRAATAAFANVGLVVEVVEPEVPVAWRAAPARPD